MLLFEGPVVLFKAFMPYFKRYLGLPLAKIAQFSIISTGTFTPESIVCRCNFAVSAQF